MRVFLLSLFFFSTVLLFAQDLSSFKFRQLGPYRGGRVTAVAGTIAEPGTFYLGATGGGLWKTIDYGTTWLNVSDGFFETPSIGAIAVAQNDPNIVYVGTGSDGLRSNVIEGKGMYKSIDGGENWMEIGLKEVGQIGAVRIDPTNHNVVYVAAIGRAFEPNVERGIFKTQDGGRSWEKVLYISEDVGCSDIEVLASNPNILFATAWKAERKPWTINSGGPSTEGGVYKSVNGGVSWDKVEPGLPQKLIGKIDIAVSPADSKIVYALVEAPEKEGGLYKSIDQGETFTLVSNDKGIRTRPFYYTNVRVDPKNTDVVFVLATGYFKSTNGGKDWKRISSPHGDNHDMWINPENPDLFIQANDGGANVTLNGGDSWSTQFNQPTAEIYQVEVDDQFPYWLYGGQQDNYTTVAVPSMPPYGIQTPGTGYIINTGGCETGPAVPKPQDPNIVYANCKGRFTVFDKRTGTEQAYYVGAANMYGHNPRDLKYRFQRVSPIHVSPHDSRVIYHCSQYVHKTTNEGKTWEIISPDLTAFEPDKQVISGAPITRDITGEEFYSTIYAIQESPIQEGLIWVGANDGPVHVSENGGETWNDVTPKGLLAGGRVDAVAPSPHNPAKAYVSILRYQLGDRKSYIFKTENYGKSWQLITTGLPDETPVRVVREDPVKEGLLFAGTEYGLFVSLDDGRSWQSFQQNLPVTPISDLKIHRGDLVLSTMGRGFWVLDNIQALRRISGFDLPENQLMIADEQVLMRAPSGATGSTAPEYPRPGVIMDYYLKNEVSGPIKLEILTAEGSLINTFVSDTLESGEDKIIRDMATENVSFLVNSKLTKKPGFNRFRWDFAYQGPWQKREARRYKNGPMAVPGGYIARLTIGETSLEENFKLTMDPRLRTTNEEAQSQLEVLLELRGMITEIAQWIDDLEKEKIQLQKESAEGQALEKVNQKLAELKTKEGIYETPALLDQVSYLYFMLNRAYQLPGKDAYDRLSELNEWYQRVRALD